jgi:DNA-binding response OmpR family regulator/CheY-specific phosphatase CheX
MKVLICDDDSATRFALKRVLLRFDCSVVEAADGMAALDILCRTPVAFVMLDIHMPVLSGVEVLQAIRSSPQHANLPVVVISAVTDQLTVAELIRLGVDDFLTKPLKAEKVAARITSMIESVGARRAAAPRAIAGPLDGSRPLVIVDGDPEFRHFVGNLLSARCPVIEAESGLDALQICLASAPGAVLLGRNIGLLAPDLLARKVRAIPHCEETRIVAVLPKGEALPVSHVLMFDAVMTRTFVSESFETQFEELFVRASPLRAILGAFPLVQPNLVSAAEQVLGMMARTDVSVVAERAEPPSPGEVVAVVTVNLYSENSALDVELRCSAEHARRLAARLLDVPESDVTNDDGLSAAGEVLNIITGRIHKAIVEQGANARFTLPQMFEDNGAEQFRQPDLSLRFETPEKDLSFLVCLSARVVEAMEAV